METIRKEEIQWLSAAIDGEGCIHASKDKVRNGYQRFRVYVDIANTDPYFLRRVTEAYCNLGIKFVIVLGSTPHTEATMRRQNMRITVLGFTQIEKLLLLIAPYLTAKRTQAETVLKFLEWRRSLFPEYVFHGKRVKHCTKTHMKNSFPNYNEYMVGLRKLSEDLKADKRKSFRLQRLPRSTSTVLDLKNLEEIEVMV